MDNQKMSLLFNAKLRSFEKLNENFLKAKCYVLALGKNANKSHFSKENVDRAYPSLSFCPVIGHLMCDENGNHYLGGHDAKLDLSTLTLKSLCVPFGVAVPNAEPIYEDVVEEDGTKSTYLVSDVVLWVGRYPELAEAIYSEEVYFGQSMEIMFSKHEPLKDDPTYTDIIDFSFDALCLLNKSDDDKFNVTPCFPSASVVPITYSINKDEFSSLMNEMKEQLSFCMNNKDNQGGKTLDEKNVILQKYGKTIEDLDFSIEEMSLEEFEKKMDETFGEKKQEIVAFSATYKQKREALCNALDPVIVKDANGKYLEETYYYVEDFDDESVYVEVDHWNENGDYDCKHGKFAYTFDENTQEATIDKNSFADMILVWMTLEEKAKLDEERANYFTLETEFSTYKDGHSYTNDEYDCLVQFKEETEKAKRITDENTLFAKYEDSIGDTKEFAELKEIASNYDLNALDKECLFIIGKYAFTKSIENKETKKPDSLKFSIETEKESKSEDPYGGLREKYLK